MGEEDLEEDEEELGVRWASLEESNQLEICQKVDMIIKGSKLPITQRVKGEYIAMLSQGTSKFQENLVLEGKIKANQSPLLQEVLNAIDQVSGEYNVRIEVKTQGGEGDKFETIKAATKMVIKGKFLGGEGDVEHIEDQVFLLFFWATWCDPAMAPMTKLNDMAFLNEDFWKNKVKIIGLNLDESKKGAQKFLTEKDWLNCEHFHVARDKCNAILNY